MINAKLSEQLAILATLDPSSQAAGAATSAWVNAANFHNLMAIVDVGAFGASATVDANLQQATSNAGAGAKAIPGKAITQLLAAGGNNRQVTIDLRDQELDSANGFNYVALVLTVGTAATETSAVILGGNPVSMPVSGLNQAGVVQQV